MEHAEIWEFHKHTKPGCRSWLCISKGLSKYYRLLRYELDITIPALDPMKCIAKIANKVSLNETTKRKAMAIMNQITEKKISAGKNPIGLARNCPLYILF